MGMVFCRGCGKEIHESAPTCPQCGAVQEVTKQANISETWKRKFNLIEKAGGSELPNIKALTFGEKFAINFNIWGMIFGPFYFLVKGMYKKSGTMFLILAALIAIDTILGGVGISLPPMVDRFTNILVPILCAYRATMCYYKETVQKEKGWSIF